MTSTSSRHLIRVGLVVTLVAALIAGTAAILWWTQREDDDSGIPGVPRLTSRTVPSDPLRAGGGALPMGDGRWSADRTWWGTDSRQEMFLCKGFAQSLNPDAPGADVRGPWISGDATGIAGPYVYRPGDKPHVRGENPGGGDVALRAPSEGGDRVLDSNGLPIHMVGTFPIARDDPAANIDRNPNTIKPSSVTVVLRPDAALGTPRCTSSLLGVLLTGARLLSPVDARGNDAVAWEVQDNCNGHPRPDGSYHYHGGSPCEGVNGVAHADPSADVDQLVGVAIDGLPITGATLTGGRFKGQRLGSKDLDICHGIVGPVKLPRADGTTETKTMYHYVLTDDWPYSVSCLRGALMRAGS